MGAIGHDTGRGARSLNQVRAEAHRISIFADQLTHVLATGLSESSREIQPQLPPRQPSGVCLIEREKSERIAMKVGRKINLAAALIDARAGSLRGNELRKVIKIAEEFGKDRVAEELKQCLLNQRVPRGQR